MAELVITFDSATGIRTGKLIGSTLLADNAVLSGKLGSGVIGPIHFIPFTSGMVVIGQDAGVIPVYGFAPAGAPGDETVTSAKLTSGAVVGDRLAYAGILSGRLASGGVGTPELLGDGIVTSAKMAASILATPHFLNQGILSASFGANVLATPHIQNAGILSASIASGHIGPGHHAALSVLSAHVGANAIATPHLANQGILSAALGANIIGAAHILDQGLLSSVYGAGSIGGAHISAYGLVSGAFASGAITEGALASGISVDISETGVEPGYRARFAISGLACVFIAPISGNYVDTALALSGSMPAVGMTQAVVLSGQVASIIFAGRVSAPASVVSGQFGRPVFVGTSGQLAVTPPSTSGRIQQIMGTVKGNDEVMLFPEPGYIEIA